ncbi:MAG TPA: SRPBCC family protein [Candidatus Binataceae bacterium]|nr:SRPBCC family protein [Candidatus Binataceae bacterium]
MSDRIEKQIDIKAPVARVWRAIADYREFGTWFRVAMEGPFVAGKEARGRITYPGKEHLMMTVAVQRIEPERLLSFTWHPYAIDPNTDYSAEPSTLVEFILEPVADGTRLTVVESGFDALPPHRRDLAFRMNEGGWAIQVQNIAQHVAAKP